MYDQPVRDYRVVTMDHVVLGRVSATASGSFCVQSGDGNFWLRKDAVFTVEQRKVTLVCTSVHVAEYLSCVPKDVLRGSEVP